MIIKLKDSLINEKIDLLNKFTIKDLNFLFTVNKKKYELSKIILLLNEIKFSSPFIEIEPNEDSYLIKGKILTDFVKSTTFERIPLTFQLMIFILKKQILVLKVFFH